MKKCPNCLKMYDETKPHNCGVGLGSAGEFAKGTTGSIDPNS